MWQSNDNVRNKQVDTSVKQSDKPKYVAHVLGGAISKNYKQRYYYNTPKYILYVLRGAVSKTYRHISESRNYRQIKTHFTRGLVKYVPERGYFYVVPSQNMDKFATSPLLFVERLFRFTSQLQL